MNRIHIRGRLLKKLFHSNDCFSSKYTRLYHKWSTSFACSRGIVGATIWQRCSIWVLWCEFPCAFHPSSSAFTDFEPPFSGNFPATCGTVRPCHPSHDKLKRKSTTTRIFQSDCLVGLDSHDSPEKGIPIHDGHAQNSKAPGRKSPLNHHRPQTVREHLFKSFC